MVSQRLIIFHLHDLPSPLALDLRPELQFHRASSHHNVEIWMPELFAFVVAANGELLELAAIPDYGHGDEFLDG